MHNAYLGSEREQGQGRGQRGLNAALTYCRVAQAQVSLLRILLKPPDHLLDLMI